MKKTNHKPEPTCLELAKEENETAYNNWYGANGRADLWEDRAREAEWKLNKSKLYVFFTLLATALIFFLSGIYFTWFKMGMPEIRCAVSSGGVTYFVHVKNPQLDEGERLVSCYYQSIKLI